MNSSGGETRAGPAHIELVGLPGAGKTRVAQRLRTRPNAYVRDRAYELALERQLLSSVPEPLRRTLPGITVRGMARISRNDPHERSLDETDLWPFVTTARELLDHYTEDNNRKQHVRRLVRYLVTEYLTIQAHLQAGETVFYDEGFLQRAISVFNPPEPADDISCEHVQDYVSAMPEPDVVVIVEVSTEIAEKRQRERDSGYPDSFNEGARSVMMNHLQRTQTLLQHIEREFTATPVFRVDNTGDLSETVSEVDDRITSEIETIR